MSRFRQQYLDSLAVPIGALLAIIAFIVIIGETFIGAYQGGEKDRLDRPELWIGIGILLGVIALMAFLASRPEDSGFLGKDVAIGNVGMWDRDLPAVDPYARYGERGTVADLRPGMTLYAQSGALAQVQDFLPGGVDYGRTFSGFIHATGIKSASREMWIPFEAVSSVYPETNSAFLAIKGDETEALGWTAPPQTITRGPAKHESAADRVK